MSNQERIKPKILVFSLTYFPFIGGAEIAIQEITKRLKNDFDFDLITLNLDGQQKEKESKENVTIYRVKNKYLYPWLAFKKAKALEAQHSYQIVWGMMATWGGWAALKFKEKFPQIKYLLTLQSGDSDKFIKTRTWFWQWRYKKIYQQADRIQVISKWLKARARKFGYKGEIEIVPNAVDINKFKVENQKNEEKEVILTVSRLVGKNGVEDLIKGFKLLNCDIAKLLIIGDGPLRDKLKNLAKDLDIQDKIIFLGHVPHDELPQYYAQADVFVRPSLSEGFGNAFIESMAAGVPVIGTSVGGIPDFLKDSETGWFCKIKNPQSIAEKIQYILDEDNKNEVARVVANAKKMVKEKYTWDIVSQQMKKIFNDLIVK